MPKKESRSPRTARVGEVIHRQIARLLYEEFKDPRIGLVTIQKVDVSPDLSIAKVFVTVYEDEKIKDTIQILNKAAGFFRSEISHLISLRTIPKLHFVYDASISKGSRMIHILDSISEKAPKKMDGNDND